MRLEQFLILGVGCQDGEVGLVFEVAGNRYRQWRLWKRGLSSCGWFYRWRVWMGSFVGFEAG